jgi:hypothetical protein
MQTFETIQEADADKMLRLNIPVEKGSCRYHVLVAMQPDPTAVASAPPQNWPPGFFERTAGAWRGELVREPQGDFERREEL